MSSRAPGATRVFFAAALGLLALGPASRSLRGQAPPHPSRALDIPTTDMLRSHLRFLSHDLLDGRAPGTRGGQLAAHYIAAQFEALGLEPGGAGDSYFQRVPLVAITPEPSLVVGSRGRTMSLSLFDDFVAWPEVPDSVVIADGELVFVGYGITAPEWNWDDYEGTLLTGKIVVALVNDPGFTDSTVFRGKALTYYGRWTYKLEQAARMGAVGVLLVHTAASTGYPWSVVRSSWAGEQLQPAGKPPGSLRFAGWITEAAARRILRAAGRDYEAMRRRAGFAAFKPMAVGANVAIHITSAVRTVDAANVVGILSGVDPGMRSQAVVYTSHYDHKGIGPPVRGDSIYNGAWDNASGVAALLATAAGFTGADTAPGRSIVFFATAAEEAGLLGSRTYVADPAVPLAETAAVINIDGANLLGATEDAVAVGADQSTLGVVFETQARAEGLAVSPDPRPESGGFFRSDQLPFARAGVPALSIRPGTTFVGRAPGWGEERYREFTARHYHQPSDEWRPGFSYDGALQQVRLMIRLGWAIGTSPDLPTWLPDSEYAAAGRKLRAGRRP